MWGLMAPRKANQQKIGALIAKRKPHVGRHTPHRWGVMWGVKIPVTQRQAMSNTPMWGHVGSAIKHLNKNSIYIL